MTPACRARLIDLLTDAFSADEISRLVEQVQVDLAHDLPCGQRTTKRDIAEAAVDVVYRRRGIVVLLDAMGEKRPGRSADIEDVRASLQPEEDEAAVREARPGRLLRVFLSYSEDSEDHVAQVVDLACRLRAMSGIESRLDKFVSEPDVGWVRWTEMEVEQADFILLICTPGYRSRFDLGTRGAIPEGILVRNEIREKGLGWRRFVPVVFDGAPAESIPSLLASFDSFSLYRDYDALVRRLMRQPEVQAPVVAPAVSLPEARSKGSGWASLDVVSQILLRASAEPLPAKLGKWTPGRRLGEGGYGTVYEADDRVGHDAAIKVFRSRTWDALDLDRGRRRFRRGPAAIQKLWAGGGHPNIVRLVDPGEDGEVTWYAMERVHGPSLADLAGSRLLERPFSERLSWFTQVASALVFAHGLPDGVVHRDLAPSNVLIDEHLHPTRAVVCDFDLARDATSETLTQRDDLGGHHCYVPPEEHGSQASDDTPAHVGVRRDLWALGMLLHFLLCGRDNLNANVRRSQREGAWRAMPAVDPKPWEDLLARLLTEVIEDRPKTAGEVLAQAERVLARSAKPEEKAPRRPGRAGWMGGAALVLACGILGFWGLWRTVSVSGEDLPSWGSTYVLVDGQRVTEPFRVWILSSHTAALGGGVDDDGDGRCDRCCWQVESPVAVRSGFGDLHVVLRPPTGLACPTEEEGLFFLEVQAPGGRLHVGSTEVTQHLYERVAKEQPCNNRPPFTAVGPDLPVCNLSWCEAVRFANLVSTDEGLPPAYTGEAACEGGGQVTWDRSSTGYRLPTTEEWASLAGSLPDPAEICTTANIADRLALEAVPVMFDPQEVVPCDDGAVGLAPVAQRQADAGGLYDLVGNVAEWTWRSDAAGAAAPTQVFLGGSFMVHRKHLLLTDTKAEGKERNERNRMAGLRIVRSVP